MTQQKVRKAVIAAAGFGTRFLPQTKAMPKEMLPLVDKPIIQYIVEQLAESGIEDIVLVTGYHKRSIEDHFDYISADLRANLKQSGKDDLLEQTKNISGLANFAYVRQKGPYGNATPLMNVRHLIGDEPFLYCYADDLIVAEPNHFRQLIELYDRFQSTVLPCLKVTQDVDFTRYGIVAGEAVGEGLLKMHTIVEKPGRDKAPSDMASVGGYLFSPDIFPYLETLQETHDEQAGEFQVQPAMQAMMADGKAIYAAQIKNSKYYDTGNKLEYVKTVVEFAKQHPDIGEEFTQYLQQMVQ